MFEDFYGEARDCFAEGTRSITKQIMEKVLLKREAQPHMCEFRMRQLGHENNSQDDTLVYKYSRKSGFTFYKIREITREGKLLVSRILTEELDMNEYGPYLRWSRVGVFKVNAIQEDVFEIDYSDITSKALIVRDFIVSIPLQALAEAK